MSAPSEFTVGTRVRTIRTGRIGHVVESPSPQSLNRFSKAGQVGVVVEFEDAPGAIRAVYASLLEALPPRTYSILTIEIPIHHPAGAKASDLAESLLDGVINSDAWMLYQGQDPGELEGEPGLYVEEVPFSAAIRSATLTEPGVQS